MNKQNQKQAVRLTRALVLFVFSLALLSGKEALARTYTTTFSLTENPISEGGNWVSARAAGLDWADIRTTSGRAIGTQIGNQGTDDSTALLTGTWGPNQMGRAIVYTMNQNDSFNEEVEIRLRSSLSPHRCTGYEVLFSLRPSSPYISIVRWNGPFNDWTILNWDIGSAYVLHDGDEVMGVISNQTITAFINGVAVLQASDSTYSSGNPGIGIYLSQTTGVNADYGFTSFTASDELGSTLNNPPVAHAQSVSTARDTGVGITLTGTDPENSPLTYAVSGNPMHGTLGGTAPNLTYWPVAAYAGPDSFTFRVHDGNAWSAPATVSIVVTELSTQPLLRSSDITLTAIVRRNRATLTGFVNVTDGNGIAIPSATVVAKWTVPNGTTVSQTSITSSIGKAKFSIKCDNGTASLTVTSLSKGGYTFDPANSTLSQSITTGGF